MTLPLAVRSLISFLSFFLIICLPGLPLSSKIAIKFTLTDGVVKDVEHPRSPPKVETMKTETHKTEPHKTEFHPPIQEYREDIVKERNW